MIKIVTDTACDLPHEIISSYDITQAVSTLVFEDEELYDDFRLSVPDFYTKLAASEEIPLTTDATVAEFQRVYTQVTAENPGATILSIHISSQMAETVANARQAAAYFPDVDIRIFDTKNVSLAEGLLVLEAARMAAAGVDVITILQTLRVIRDTIQLYVIVDTLEYFAKVGRIGPVERFFGTLTGIKPVLYVVDGQVEAHSNPHTRIAAVATLRRLALQAGAGLTNLRLAVGHTQAPKDAHSLCDHLQSRLNPAHTLCAELGPSIAVNTGPNALGVVLFGLEDS